MTQLTKSEILSRFVDGATFGPTEMASSNDMFDTLVFCTGENEITGKQKFRNVQEWVNIATAPSKPPMGYMVIYYKDGDIYVIDDTGTPRRLAWATAHTSLETTLRAWVMASAYIVSDRGQILWPDEQVGMLSAYANHDELTYPGYIIRLANDRKSLPEVTNA